MKIDKFIDKINLKQDKIKILLFYRLQKFIVNLS